MILIDNGVHGGATLNIMNKSGVIIHNAVKFITKESSDNISEISISLSDIELAVSYMDKDYVYEFKTYRTTHELFKKIKDDCEKGIIPLTVLEVHYDIVGHPCESLVSCNSPRLVFTKGSSGLESNKNQFYHSVDEVLRFLVGSNIDVIILANCYIDDTILKTGVRDIVTEDYVLLDLYTDDNRLVYGVSSNSQTISEDKKLYINQAIEGVKSDNLEEEVLPDGGVKVISFYKLLFEFVKAQSLYGIVTKAVIGFKPLLDKEDVATHFHLYKDYIDGIIPEKYEEHKSLISICVGDLYYDNGGTVDNSYIAYASALVECSYISNTENYSYHSSIQPRVFFEKEIIKKIIEYGYVYSRKSYLTKNTHVFNSVTTSSKILKYEFVVRSLQQFYKKYMPVMNTFIGDIINSDSEKIFKKKVVELFNEYIANSICVDYDFSISNFNNEDTVILANFYYPGFLSPIKTIIEMR